MSPEKPLLVVLGATGNQGGSVISHFLSLSPPPYKIRGVTRNPASPKSAALASLGVEMVAGDFEDPASLDAAFKGASVIFSVTDFWQAFFDPSQREKAAAAGQNIGLFCRERETRLNRNIIDAVTKVETLERFVYSGLPNTGKVSGGKYPHVYHFEGKGIAEEYGKATYPKFWTEKTSVLYAGLYLENYFGPSAIFFRPILNKAKDTLVLTLAAPLATAPFPMYSVVDDTGALVHALIQDAPGQRLIGVNEWLSVREVAGVLAEVLGKKIEYVDTNPNFVLGDPDLDEDNASMMGFCVEFRYDGGAVDKGIVEPADLGVPVKLTSVKEWCAKQDWDKCLQVAE